jgi:hypothetical protein
MNLARESGLGLSSRPVRAQIVSFYCSSGAPILSSPGGRSKPGSELSENQPGETRADGQFRDYVDVFYRIATPAIAAKAKKTAIYKAQRFSDRAPPAIDYDL